MAEPDDTTAPSAQAVVDALRLLRMAQEDPAEFTRLVDALLELAPEAPPGVGTTTHSLAGIRPCGCITAALALDEWTTTKDVRDFCSDMAKTGRAVEWRPDEQIRARLFRGCDEQHPVKAAVDG